MDLNPRQVAFLLAAFEAAPAEGNSFKWRDARAAAEPPFDPSESYDLAYQLERGHLLRLDEDVAFLNPDGRELGAAVEVKAIGPVTLNDAESRFILAAFSAAAPGEEFVTDAVAQAAGVADPEPVRRKLLDAGLLDAGSTFGTLHLTAAGISVVGLVRKMRLLAALYHKVGGDLVQTFSLPELGVEFGIADREALEAAAELARAGLVTPRYRGVVSLTEAGRDRAAGMLNRE